MFKILSILYLSLMICTHQLKAQCAGTPQGGTTISNISYACASDTITLTINNSTTGEGLTYQWQASSDSLNWTDISGIVTDTASLLQQNLTYYRRFIYCGDSSAVSIPIKVSAKPLLQCYCKPASNCTQNDRINRVQMGTLNNASGCSANGYIDYSGIVAAPAFNEAAVVPVSVTVSAGGTEYVALWIDYDQNGKFDANEYTSVGFGNGVTITAQVPIPENIPTGLTKMRVRVRYNIALSNTDACAGTTYGETEDYLVNIQPAPLCSSLPAGGSTTASSAIICPIDSSRLIVTGATMGFTGLTYQWQQSADSVTWINMPGDTFISKTIIQTGTTFYRRTISCGALQAFSTPVKIATKDSTLCYCRPAGSQCNTTATITAVRFSSLHNTSNCSALGYGDYSSLPPTPVMPGITVPVSVSAFSISNTVVNYFAVWIDYNKNGIFESTEFSNLGSLQGTGTISSSISIPSDAAIGTTGMRIRCRYNTALTAANACTDYAISETEDYLLLVDLNCIVNTWTGLGGDNNWETAANWSCQHVPVQDETVVVNNGSTIVVNSNVSIYSLILNPGANFSVTPSFTFTVTK